MATGVFVSYLRVSTERQGKSGLGLEAQRKAVADYLNGGKWTVVSEVVEIESGKKDDRPKLAEALALCRVHNATLVIAKLDRLSRDVHFLTGLQKAGVRFVAADMPEANEMVVQIMAVVAQAERKMISKRTKEALAAKKVWLAGLTEEAQADLQARGKALKLGNPGNLRNQAKGSAKGLEVRRKNAAARVVDLAPILAEVRADGASSLREIATKLNDRHIPTARGGIWSAVQVKRLLEAGATNA